MRKVLVLQHVAHEILGTLNPLLKEHRLKIKYVNFEREPNSTPSIEGYNGLVVLGGPMGVYQSDQYPHVKHELKLIETALKMDIPVLGICLGAQMIAHVLGATVAPHAKKEIGWHKVLFKPEAKSSELFAHFNNDEIIFQAHGDSFDVPKSCTHLAWSEVCEAQAFSYGKKAFGLQFHLEVDEPMIKRWLNVPSIKKDIESLDYVKKPEEILADTVKYIRRSLELSEDCFRSFVELFDLPERPTPLDSGHGKPRKIGH